jgi:hypothetical protein
MNASALTVFATAMARNIRDLYGSTVTIDGTDYTAAVSTGSPTLDLEAGGFRSPVSFVVRIPKEDLETAPETKAEVVINSKTYRVMSVRQNFSPLAQEWIIEVENA